MRGRQSVKNDRAKVHSIGGVLVTGLMALAFSGTDRPIMAAAGLTNIFGGADF